MKFSKNSFRQAFLLIIVFLIGGLITACSSGTEELIDLNALTPLPTQGTQEATALRVAIAAVISPQGTLESYTPLLEYLEKQLGRPVERVQGSTYAETNEILASGLADLAFVCTGAYVHGSDDFGMQLLVVPEIEGKTFYQSWIIVPSNSSVQELSDLRGGVFAFTDPLSLTGWMYPNSLLMEMEKTAEDFFGRTYFTNSHDLAIRAVADGFADGAAVDSLIYTYLLNSEPDLAEKLRVIHKSPPFGMPPVVTGPSIEPELRAQLQEVFLAMSDDAQGQAALKGLGIDRFVIIDDQIYDSARRIELAMPIQATVAP